MQESERHRSLKRTTAAVVGIVVLIAILAFLLALFMVHFLVDLWWFNSVGYGFYFWQRRLYSYTVFTIVTTVFFFIFLLNFRLVTRPLRKSRSSSRSTSRLGRLGRALRSGSRFVYIPLSAILTLIVALPLFHNWEKGFMNPTPDERFVAYPWLPWLSLSVPIDIPHLRSFFLRRGTPEGFPAPARHKLRGPMTAGPPAL